jgi:hypothetical protein
MSELGLVEYFSMAEALGIITTLFVILYFSRKQMQSLSVDVQTKVLNDLDEKVRKMSYTSLKNHLKSYHLCIMSCLFVPMHTRCAKEKCLMTMNGQGGYSG